MSNTVSSNEKNTPEQWLLDTFDSTGPYSAIWSHGPGVHTRRKMIQLLPDHLDVCYTCRLMAKTPELPDAFGNILMRWRSGDPVVP
jgi:hypothetical protein